MGIANNPLRAGNFTASTCSKLFSKARNGIDPGAAYFTYIKQKKHERRLGRSIDTETYGKPTMWGKSVEGFVFENVLSTAYSLNSQETIQNENIPFLVGSPDGFKYDEGKTVIDIKCPYTLESFCDLVEPLYIGLSGIDAINWIRNEHKSGEDYYWQLVANSLLTDSKYAELIVFMPTFSMLSEMKVFFDGNPDCYFIVMSKEDELPYILDDGFYKPLNIIRFEVPIEDKIRLTLALQAAGKLLTGESNALPTTEPEAPLKALKTPKKVKQIEPVSLFDPNSIVLTPINK